MRRIAALTVNPFVVAVVMAIALTGCASKKIPNDPADLGLRCTHVHRSEVVHDADIVLVHAPCGTELEQGFWCRQCATTFGPAAIRAAARDRTDP